MTKKNILQTVEHLLPGGAERMAVNISNVLANNGYNVVLCPTRALGALKDEVQNNVKLTCLNKTSFWDVKAFIKFYKIINKYKIDCIHAHSTSIIWACIVKVFKPNLKIIWHDHYGNRVTDNNNTIYKKISFLINGIITVNQELKKWSEDHMKIKNRDNIICLNNFPILKENSNFKTDKTTITIVLLANLRIEKDHLSFVKALAIVKNKIDISNIEILFAGLYWENEYLKEIKEIITKNDLADKIQFLGSVNNVSDLLNNSHIGVICSTFEGLPVSLLEYGLAGLAVIVTDVGQCAEVVDFGKAGVVIPKSNPDLLAEALLKFINDKELRHKVGDDLKNRVLNKYGANNFLNKYNVFLHNL